MHIIHVFIEYSCFLGVSQYYLKFHSLQISISLKKELDDTKHALESRESEIDVLQQEKKRMMDSINYQQVAIAKLKKDCKQMEIIKNEMIDIQEQMKVCSLFI